MIRRGYSARNTTKQKGFGSLPLMVGITSGIMILSLSAGLWFALESRGALKQANTQLTQDLADANQAYARLENERKRVEIITLDNLETKEIIEVEKIREVEVVKEIVKRVPAEDCLNQPLPPDLVCLLDSESCDEAPDTEDVSPVTTDAGHQDTETVTDGPDL